MAHEIRHQDKQQPTQKQHLKQQQQQQQQAESNNSESEEDRTDRDQDSIVISASSNSLNDAAVPMDTDDLNINDEDMRNFDTQSRQLHHRHHHLQASNMDTNQNWVIKFLIVF